MLKRGYKLIISVVLVATLFITFSASSFAILPAAGAGLLGSALGSVGVDLLAGGAATAGALAIWLNGDFSISGVLTGVADGYIKVNDDSVIIDGVEYQSIFLDPNMASELHTQAFDFITQKAITDNSSGILASGYGYFDGIPLYNVNGEVRSQTFSLPNSSGTVGSIGISYSATSYNTNVNRIVLGFQYSDLSQNVSNIYQDKTESQFDFYFERDSLPDITRIRPRIRLNPSYDSSFLTGAFRDHPNTVVADSFNYSYVSGNIDATPLPSNYGFQLYVPSGDLSGAGIVPGTYYNDGQLALVQDLIELLDTIYSDGDIVDADFTEEITPDPPIPDTTIADTAYADLHDEMLDIKNNQAHANSALDNIDSNIDVIGRTVDNLDQTVTDIEGYIQTGTTDIVEAVDTAGQTIEGKLDDIEGAIDTYGQSVVSEIGNVETAVDTAGQSVVDSVDAQTQALEESIADVAEKVESLDTTVDEVIEKIETHPLDLFGAFLDRLTEIPVIKDLFDGIKQHVGIWHYVVEWLQCIGTFLSFFIGLFADVAYCMVVPIYACVAGAICLAFYKRFGR